MGNSVLRCMSCAQVSKPNKQQQQGKRRWKKPDSSRPSSPPDKPPKRMKSSDLCSMEKLPSAHDGITRMKLVLSPEQVDGMLSGNCDKDDFLLNLLASVLSQHNISRQSLMKEASAAASAGAVAATQPQPQAA